MGKLFGWPLRKSKTSDSRQESSSGQADRAIEFLPDEERVRQFLEQYGGYTWQGHIGAELGWGPSKVSRILSAMEDRGEIHRRRVGRKKAVFLDEALPEVMRDDGQLPPLIQ